MIQKQYFVYLLTNRWKNVLYVGITNSLERRIWQHKNKAIPGFTKKYNCDLLVHYEMFERVESAIAREKQIKGWTRAKKNALVELENPKWLDLAADWYSKTPPESGGSFAVYAAQDDRGRHLARYHQLPVILSRADGEGPPPRSSPRDS